MTFTRFPEQYGARNPCLAGMAWYGMALMVRRCLGGSAPPSALSPVDISRRFGRVYQHVSSSWSNDGTKQNNLRPVEGCIGPWEVDKCEQDRGDARGQGAPYGAMVLRAKDPITLRRFQDRLGWPRLAPLHHVVSFVPSSFDFDCLLQRTLLEYTSASGI
jgi:hypothetical protein